MTTRSKLRIDRFRPIAVAVASTLALGAAATAPTDGQEATPDLGARRFEFHQVDSGYLRLDLRTGDVALCSQRPVGWTCAMAPEERAAMADEIARLQRENVDLKSALLKPGLPAPNGVTAEPCAPPPYGAPPASAIPDAPRATEPSLRLPERADIDRLIALTDRLWRRLVEMVGSLQRDIQRR